MSLFESDYPDEWDDWELPAIVRPSKRGGGTPIEFGRRNPCSDLTCTICEPTREEALCPTV
jgi:hypothetical protein